MCAALADGTHLPRRNIMRLAIGILAAALASAPAIAQRANTNKQPAQSNKEQAQSKQDSKLNAAAMAFAKKVTVANKYEIEAGQVALDKAQRDDVKQLAQMIVSDHEKAGNDLKTAVGAEASGLPAALDSKH